MGLYRSLVRPALFTLPPETSHHLAETAFRLPLPWRAISGSSAIPDLPVDLTGIALRNPVGLAAGFDKNCAELRGLAALGFGYLVGGTVSRLPREGNPRPRIARDRRAATLTNAMGIPNRGVEAVASNLRSLGRLRAAVFVSLADEDVSDVLAAHEALAPLVDGFELNVSSPNSPWRHDRTDDAAYLVRVLTELGRVRERPLFVKLPPFRTPEEQDRVLGLARIAADGGADGLTCGNTVPVEDARLVKGRGGLSGRALVEHTPRMVEQVRRAIDLPVNACGGLATAENARRCLDAGATTVQLYTGLIYEGPRVVRSIVSGLALPLAGPAVGVQDG
ncbi:MAG: dihydroorotate dehydrogenase 2 [Actinomycetota bacterium]